MHQNKKPIGVRLAKTALNRAYGQLALAYRGPQYNYVVFDKSKATIHFSPESVSGGLATKDGNAPTYFTVAGADKIFHPSTAKITGSAIELVSPNVQKPVAVRSAFTNFPVTNLQNDEGIPA
ncbi:MAG: 9-O-acetylesterase, partial [Flavobacteriales bacterium]